ncbi:hypothetical protein T484DRAFT_1974656 [Baffinella frigidus]|nr:hypothetical protein T484DRAFT_1974656 [Cryptophyta sp. CCMP2293]
MGVTALCLGLPLQVAYSGRVCQLIKPCFPPLARVPLVVVPHHVIPATRDTIRLSRCQVSLLRRRATVVPGCIRRREEDHPLSPLHEHLHWRAKRDPKAKMLSLQSFLRKGVALAYVGRN